MSKVALKVFKFDPSLDTCPKYKTYELNVEEDTTLLMALRHIYEKIDKTLAFRNYCCAMGPRCGSCLLKVNGKTIYSCNFLIKGGEELAVEPLTSYPIVKDLVVDWGTYASNDFTWVIRKGALVKKVK